METGEQFSGFLDGNNSSLTTGTKMKEVGVLFLAVSHTKDMLNQAIALTVECGQTWSNAEDGVVQATVKVAVD